MITVVQRVAHAEVRVDGAVVGQINRGLLLFVGVERNDSEADAAATARKVARLRIFPRDIPAGPEMDRSILDIGGACLVVSQFTLAGNIHRGNRPSFETAEQPPRARILYEQVVADLRAEGLSVATGQFAADMAVHLLNDGPVTFIVEARGGALVNIR